MIQRFTPTQQARMNEFIWSMCAINPKVVLATARETSIGKCFIGLPGQEVYECMATAFSSDGHNAYGITFDGEFIFFEGQSLLRWVPAG